MGYDIHIHRRADWTDVGDDITSDEWRAVYEADESLTIYGAYGYREGENVRETPVIGWPAPDCAEAAFTLYRGGIRTKNPSASAIRKAWEIADKLGAKVQGDDGEFYSADGKNCYYEPGDNELPVEMEAPARSEQKWWRKLFNK
ncbi:MAG: hypothetical protein ABUS48_03705 [Pseudomonadota bacterium]